MSIANSIRNLYYKYRIKKVGKNVCIGRDVSLISAKNIVIGDNVWIGDRAIFSAKGGITIGNNISMGPEVLIWTDNHDFYKPDKLPFNDEIIKKPVVIEDNVWLGARCSIVPGVTIGEGAVVAMGSVVTKDVESCAVVAGNPAKIIKYRDKERYYQLKQQQENI